jgi:hypothetical protein
MWRMSPIQLLSSGCLSQWNVTNDDDDAGGYYYYYYYYDDF